MKIATITSVLSLVFVINGCNVDRTTETSARTELQPIVDISSFAIDRLQIGAKLPRGSDGKVAKALREDLLKSGISISADDAVVTAIYVELRNYNGEFSYSGDPMAISIHSSPSDILRVLGKPYWQHKLDEDTLIFYESKSGSREVTFTFNESNKLRFVDISDHPLFADPKQRERYGLKKPWPPKS